LQNDAEYFRLTPVVLQHDTCAQLNSADVGSRIDPAIGGRSKLSIRLTVHLTNSSSPQ
jgi:hypothetical protein